MKNHFMVLGALLIFSGIISPSIAQQNETVINFELTILVTADAQRTTTLSYIKAALQPLGIDVKIRILDPNSWTNVISGEYNGTVYPFDVNFAKWFIGFNGQQRVMGDLPATSPFFTGSGEGLVDSELAETATGKTISDLDSQIVELQSLTDINAYKEKINEFADDWMNEYLFTIPLIRLKSYFIHPPGLDGEITKSGILNSILKGAHWNGIPPSGDETTLRVEELLFGTTRSDNFDTNQPIRASLIDVDSDLSVHPNIAVQWEQSDWVVNASVTIPNAKHKFILRDDAYWFQSRPSQYGNFPAGTHRIGPKDFGFAFDIEQAFVSGWFVPLPNLVDNPLQQSHVAAFSHYEIDEAENSISFFTKHPSVKDIHLLRRLVPYPEFHLNQTLTTFDGINGTPAELIDLEMHPVLTTKFFEFWFSETISSGPYYLSEETSEAYIYKLREDYFYPNEWDSPEGDFIKHQPGIEEAVFNTFNVSESDPQRKPTTLLIDEIHAIFETSSAHGDLLDGRLDLLLADPGSNPVLFDELFNDANLGHTEIFPRISGFNLFLDFSRNEHIRNFNVRRAIAHAIDKSSLIQIFGGHAVQEDSIIWVSQEQFYSDQWAISYDYPIARDLMRGEGYVAEDTNEFNLHEINFQPSTIIVPDELRFNLGSVMLGLIAISIYGRKKINRGFSN